MTSPRQGLGRRGEELALNRLKSLGYAILAKNHRTPHGEIDLVAKHEGTLVFVEVRTKRGGSFGSPEESITPSKRAHLIASAQEYVSTNEVSECDWRIDLVAVELDSSGRLQRIEVIENAVEG